MGMEPAQWLAAFRELHERCKKGNVQPSERGKYMVMRNELAASLLAAQGMSSPPGAEARKHFRVAQVMQMELNRMYKVVTRDISRAGFSCTMEPLLADGEKVSFSLVLKHGEPPISGEAKVVAMVKQAPKVARASFSIVHLNEADAEKLEIALFDAVLARFK